MVASPMTTVEIKKIYILQKYLNSQLLALAFDSFIPTVRTHTP